MWLWIFATVLAFFVKGLCGFANTLVFTSVLGFGVNNINISPVELVLGLPSNIILTWKNRKKLKAKVVIPLSILVLAGCIPGALLLKSIDAGCIKIFFGAIVCLISIEMFLRESGKIKIRESKIFLILIGILSGILCGLYGVGALLVAYIGRVTKNTEEFKANISAVFIVENIFRIILYSVLGVINSESLKYSLMLLPAMLFGLFLGMLSAKFINEKIAKKLVIILLLISGIALILKNTII